MKKPQKYREFIDYMVEVCQHGQGSISSNRARAGLWHRDATAEHLVEERRINQLLEELNGEQRELIAKMLADEFENGVFESLKALEYFEIEPFIEGYEGSPHHDFVGRVDLDQWEWPKDE